MGELSFAFAKLLYRIPFIENESQKFNDFRHNRINQLLAPEFEEAYKKTEILINRGINSNESKLIWFFWWQGKESMPELVLKCYQSILSNSGKYQVQLVTKNNINEYINVSKSISEKLREGTISLTHFSDIVRFKLLEKYGGLWLDATIFITKSLNNVDTSSLFTCSGYPKNRNFNVAKGRWTGFCMGGPSQSPLFIFMNNFFEIYWHKYNHLLDFFLIDYALNFAWEKNLNEFQNITKKYQKFDPQMFNLFPILNKQFNKKIADELIEDSFIFKLSNRKRIQNDKKNFFENLSKLQTK